MDDILVSIRCITYNHAPYIRQCLDGFVMQKTNFRFEAIVHDDASTDGTADIVREYAEKYPEIIKPVFQTENQYSKRDGSLTRALDAAMSAASKYVAVCEGDDYWIDPYKLQKQVDFLEGHPEYSMCFHNAVVFNDEHDRKNLIFNNLSHSQIVSLKMITDNWIIPTASIVFRKNCYRQPEWASKIYSGDMLLALMCYSVGKLYYLNEVMSFYRKNLKGGSMSACLNNNSFFVIDQHAMLYNYYNQETNRKYEFILKRKIRELRRTKRFIALRRKSLLLAILLNPVYVFKRLKYKISLLNEI